MYKLNNRGDENFQRLGRQTITCDPKVGHKNLNYFTNTPNIGCTNADLMGVGRACAHALTQQLNQLAFRRDAVKSAAIFIFILPTQVFSSHNKRGRPGPLH